MQIATVRIFKSNYCNTFKALILGLVLHCNEQLCVAIYIHNAVRVTMTVEYHKHDKCTAITAVVRHSNNLHCHHSAHAFTLHFNPKYAAFQFDTSSISWKYFGYTKYTVKNTQRNISNSYQLCTLLLSKWKRVMCLVPGTEWCAVNADDTVLHEGFGAYKLVITSIVQHINDASLPCYRWHISTLSNSINLIFT